MTDASYIRPCISVLTMSASTQYRNCTHFPSQSETMPVSGVVLLNQRYLLRRSVYAKIVGCLTELRCQGLCDSLDTCSKFLQTLAKAWLDLDLMSFDQLIGINSCLY